MTGCDDFFHPGEWRDNEEEKVVQKLSAPTGVTATTQSSSSIRLSWNKVSGAQIYYVYYSTSTTRPAGNPYDYTTSTYYDFSGLSSGTTYYFWVSAWNESFGEGLASSRVSAKTSGSTVPVPVGMVYVEPGTFQMGSTSGESDEKPVHSVTLTRGFYMSDHEVTQAEWKAVMGTTPSYYNGDDNPVESVSWYDAVNYCNKLSQNEGRAPAYTINGTSVTWNDGANGYRLPTEAEWEYAARGGNQSKGYTYSGSNTVDDVAWYWGNSSSGTRPVKGKKANELGIYDMSGNVWEWCWDWYGSYASGAQTDPSGAGAGSYRVARGGSWDNDATFTRVANRNGTTHRGSNLGFRVVCF